MLWASHSPSPATFYKHEQLSPRVESKRRQIFHRSKKCTNIKSWKVAVLGEYWPMWTYEQGLRFEGWQECWDEHQKNVIQEGAWPHLDGSMYGIRSPLTLSISSSSLACLILMLPANLSSFLCSIVGPLPLPVYQTFLYILPCLCFTEAAAISGEN